MKEDPTLTNHTTAYRHTSVCIRPFRPVFRYHKEGLVPISGLKLVIYATSMILTTLKTITFKDTHCNQQQTTKNYTRQKILRTGGNYDCHIR